jgi:hypothetical protein
MNWITLKSRQKRKIAEMLDSTLTQVQTGGSVPPLSRSGDDFLARELNSLVETALQVKDALTLPYPGQSTFERLERKLFFGLRERTANPSRQARPFPGRRLRALPASLTMILVFGLLTATLGVASASASSLPGDALYSVKIGLENVRLALTFSPERELRLISRFSEERTNEMAALTGKGRYQDLELAAAQYSRTLERMLSLREAHLSSGDMVAVSALDGILSQQVETLLRVQDQVPAQAFDAIQGALDHALDKGQRMQDGGEKVKPDDIDLRATQTMRSQARQEEKDIQTAQQIARKYGLTEEQVLELFHSTCQGDWKCVREVYRESVKEK